LSPPRLNSPLALHKLTIQLTPLALKEAQFMISLQIPVVNYSKHQGKYCLQLLLVLSGVCLKE
jgi:hypothetical protein